MVEEVIKITVDSSQAEAATAKTKQGVADLKNSVQDTGKAAKEAGSATGELKNKLDAMTGGAISGFKGMLAGARAQIAAMGVLKAAVLATGIGALLLAFAAIGNYLTKTEEGAQKLKVIMSQVGAAISVVFDRVIEYYKMLYKIVTLDFTGAAESAKAAFSGFGDELEREVIAAGKLTQALYEIKEAEDDLLIARAKQNKALVEKRELLEDENLSIDAKIALLKEVSAAEDELNQKEVANAKAYYEALKEQGNYRKLSAEENDAIDEAKIKYIDLETQSIQKQIKVKKQINRLENEQSAEAKKLQEERQKAYEDRLKKEEEAREAAFKKEREDYEKQYGEIAEIKNRVEVDNTLQNSMAVTKMLNEQEMKRTDFLKEQSKVRAEINAAEANAKLEIAYNALNVIGELFGRESAAGKAAAIGQATINTYQAATNALANTPLPPPFPQIAAGLTVAQGLLQVRNIMRTRIPNGYGGAGGSGPSGGGISTPSFSTPTVNIPGQSGINSIVSGFGSSQNPIQAYVVASAVTSGQELNRKKIANATFG